MTGVPLPLAPRTWSRLHSSLSFFAKRITPTPDALMFAAVSKLRNGDSALTCRDVSRVKLMCCPCDLASGLRRSGPGSPQLTPAGTSNKALPSRMPFNMVFMVVAFGFQSSRNNALPVISAGQFQMSSRRSTFRYLIPFRVAGRSSDTLSAPLLLRATGRDALKHSRIRSLRWRSDSPGCMRL